MNETFQRQVSVEATRAEGKDSRLEMSLSSEYPVETADGILEILDHSPGNVDLARFSAGAPFLADHNPEKTIGIIEKAWLSADKKLRAVIRFSKNSAAQEIYRDFLDGVRKNVSIGYRRTKQIGEEVIDGARAIRFSFQPYEASAVSIPADFSVGLGRSHQTNLGHRVERTEILMNNQTSPEVAEIRAIAAHLKDKTSGDIVSLAERRILEGTSLEAWRSEALSFLPEARPIQHRNLDLDVKPRDWQRFNIAKAILEFADRGQLSGVERELSDEISLQSNRRPASFWVPTGMNNQRSAQLAGVATLGGHLIETSIGNFIESLRANMVFGRMGIKTMAGLQGNVALPRVENTGTVQWLAETSTCTLSELNFTQVGLSPKCAAAGLEYSKMLLAQSNVHDVVLTDLTKSISAALDAAIGHGAGTLEPTGLAIATGVNAVTLGSNGAVPSWDAIVKLEEVVATANGSLGASGYVTNPKVRSYLKKTALIANVSGPAWPVERSTDGFETLNAYRAATSSAIAANLTIGTNTAVASAAFFSSDWSQAVLGMWGGLDIQVDAVTGAANRLVRVYAHQYCDFQLKQPACFSRCLQLLAG